MSIQIVANSLVFYDLFGNALPKYKANAGDYQTMQFDITESIYFRTNPVSTITSNNVLTTAKKLKFPNYESLNGFAVGQNVTLKKTKPNNTTVTKATTIVSIDYTTSIVEFASLFTSAADNLFLYDGTTVLEVYSADMRQELTLSLGLNNSSLPLKYDTVASTLQGAYLGNTSAYRKSEIDNTIVQFEASATNTIIVGGGSAMTSVGTKSGHFGATVTIDRLTDVSAIVRKWRITIVNTQMGALTEDLFNSQLSTKGIYYIDLEWYSLDNFLDPTVVQWNFNSDTGWFDEGFNSAIPNSIVTQFATNPLYFDSEVTNTVIIESSATDLTIGACYVPEDITYFKNKYYTQQQLCMFLQGSPNFNALIPHTYISNANPTGAQYQIEVTAYSKVGTTHTITFKFKYVNQAFIDFMLTRDEFDRTFYIWFQVGNVNLLVWSFDIGENPIPTLSLTDFKPNFVDNYIKIQTDKTSNFYPLEGTGAVSGFYSSTEDNLNFRAELMLQKNKRYNKLTYQLIVAEIADTTNFFQLQANIFDLTTQVFNPTTGITEINMTQQNSYNLQSVGKIASIRRASPYVDLASKFGCTMEFGFLIDWRYWLAESIAFLHFAPNRTQDFLNYNDGTYGLFVRVLLERDDANYEYLAQMLDIYDYDEVFSTATEEWGGTTSIEYYDTIGNQQPCLIAGDTAMRVLIRVNTTQTVTTNSYWGMLTIEPKEASPRWLLSSNYNFNNNINSPLYPIAGQVRLQRDLINANEVTYSCLIDCDKLTGTNQKITLKHFNNSAKIEQVRTVFDTKIATITPSIVTEEENDCCDIFKVFADLTDLSVYKNDKTNLWHALLGGGDSVVFELYKSNGILATTQPTFYTFPSQANARYGILQWMQVLTNDGEGCYELRVKYTSAYSVVTTTVWGNYHLQQWNRDTVEGLVNIQSFLNSNQTIEGIDFTGTFMQESLNVEGFFGNRDPRMEIDNVIFNTRLTSKVVRENLNQYTLNTNPITRMFTRKLLDLILLSENDTYITDYNSFNHEVYTFKRFIVEEVSTPIYEKYSKLAEIIVKFGDKIKNSRSNFK